MAVSHRENNLKIDGRKFKFDDLIQKIVEYPDRIIILFGYENFESEQQFAGRNLIAVGRDGNILWRVADSNELFPDSETSIEPFVGFGKTKINDREALVAYQMFGMCYEVDPQTGALSNPRVSR